MRSDPIALWAPTCDDARALRSYLFKHAANADPISAGERTVTTPAAFKARYFASAVPPPREMMAPACPMRLPGGAVTPAM